MANPCLPSKPHTLIPAGTGSDLRFSSEQIGLLRQMARESRAVFMMSRLGKSSQAAQRTLALFFRVPAVPEKRWRRISCPGS